MPLHCVDEKCVSACIYYNWQRAYFWRKRIKQWDKIDLLKKINKISDNMILIFNYLQSFLFFSLAAKMQTSFHFCMFPFERKRICFYYLLLYLIWPIYLLFKENERKYYIELKGLILFHFKLKLDILFS